ncbi:MAG: hypothetical protein HYS98_03160 [Deltaproteobacteria bacterium]|nr:hypothetical protein [Deltaproteobacteria bacterium]
MSQMLQDQERRHYFRKKVKAQVVLHIKGAVEEDYKTYVSHNLSEPSALKSGGVGEMVQKPKRGNNN